MDPMVALGFWACTSDLLDAMNIKYAVLERLGGSLTIVILVSVISVDLLMALTLPLPLVFIDLESFSMSVSDIKECKLEYKWLGMRITTYLEYTIICNKET
jgi:hypothetical protein